MNKILIFIFLLSCAHTLSAQEKKQKTSYNSHDFFAEKYAPPTPNEFRSAQGIPGRAYWQNRADYWIRVSLNEKENSVSGELTILYTNNSPDNLRYVWLNLDQNIFRPQSRGANTAIYPGNNDDIVGEPKGGFVLGNVNIIQHGKSYAVDPLVNDTRMQLCLQDTLLPDGDTLRVTMQYSFKIPDDGSGRFGKQPTKNGVIYQIAQWYPRMCVYDDIRGWNTLPYLGQGEFYLDYGNFDYFVTAPAEMFVFGSGDLQNPSEVLTAQQIKRLEQAATSDKTVMIVSPEETANPAIRPSVKGSLTWHFKMSNTREVAWAAGKGMVWDAARVNVPSGKKVLAMSAYPVESVGQDSWSRSTEYLKAAMEIYSKKYFEYPWNTAVSSAGITSGMEYPGMIFDDYREKGARLWFLIAHEIGHNWYPHIVGSNERRYMWFDEGLNTFINHLATQEFNRREYVNAPEFKRKTFFALKDYELFMHYRDPLMTVSDAMNVGEHFQYYGRTAYGLDLLRNVILGRERFDKAFRLYTEAWAFKHPAPYDFFNSMNNASGEDLGWFWKGWFFTNWRLDQAVTDVMHTNDADGRGAIIKLQNRDKMIMPVIIKIYLDNGKEEMMTLPVELWQRGDTYNFFYPTSGKVVKVVLDPEKALPDMDRSNNEWPVK